MHQRSSFHTHPQVRGIKAQITIEGLTAILVGHSRYRRRRKREVSFWLGGKSLAYHTHRGRVDDSYCTSVASPCSNTLCVRELDGRQDCITMCSPGRTYVIPWQAGEMHGILCFFVVWQFVSSSCWLNSARTNSFQRQSLPRFKESYRKSGCQIFRVSERRPKRTRETICQQALGEC